jgi:hypothetical protein
MFGSAYACVTGIAKFGSAEVLLRHRGVCRCGGCPPAQGIPKTLLRFGYRVPIKPGSGYVRPRPPAATTRLISGVHCSSRKSHE